MADQADVLVIGSGHNGLVAASYMAQAGLSVQMLEQRSVVGGLTTTEEMWPGFSAEPASQIAHGIEPKIYRDMRLFDYKIEAVRPDPYLLMPFPDGRRFVGWRSKKRLQSEVQKFSEADAAAWFDYRNMLNELAEDLRISPLDGPPSVEEMMARAAGSRHREDFYKLVFGTIQDFFDERFESEEIKSVLSLLASAFNLAGPMSSSAYLLLHWALPVNSKIDSQDGEDLQFRGGTLRTKGGIGAITRAMADSARASGVAIHTDMRVERIIVERGAARGVRLHNGQTIRANYVVSNADPKATLVGMVGPDHLEDRTYRELLKLKRNGNACKFVMALAGTPVFAIAQDEAENTKFLRSSFRFCPSMEYQERAYDDAKYGVPSRNPIIYGQCPTAIDPELAPPGKHLLALTVFHAPYKLRSGTWAQMKAPFAERIISTVEIYIPNIREILIDWKLFSPEDIERRYGTPGGSPTHGEMTFARLLGLWPASAGAGYSTPIQNLYICGAGGWPGGSVTGAPGHNAAHKLIADAGLTGLADTGAQQMEGETLTRGW
jgi:phytoene dehydrogenase-like protein